jgi:CHAT domain-containing protein/Tfp pilus assembly protein PilF
MSLFVRGGKSMATKRFFLNGPIFAPTHQPWREFDPRDRGAMSSSSIILLFATILISGCAVRQADYQISTDAARESVGKGETGAFLTSMEVQALEAETRRDWTRAASAYTGAAWASWGGGQLQKALSHSTKAVESAMKANDLELQVRAIGWLAYILTRLGQHDQAKKWIETAIETTRKMPAGLTREAVEGLSYMRLGLHFLEIGAFHEATESLVYSVRLQESRLDFYANRGFHDAIPNTAHALLLSVNHLGRAYQQTGQFQEGIEVYQKGIEVIRRYQLTTHVEGNLYQGLGRLYAAQGDFSRALDSLKKALEFAERLNLAELIQSANHEMGELYRRMQRPDEAVPYYGQSIRQTESIRSLLQSEEHRRSFFEGGLNAYVGMIEALLASGRLEEAFNFNERARSRAFLDALGSKTQLSRIKGSYADQERALHELKVSLRTKLSVDPFSPTDRENLTQELAVAEKAYDDFLTIVRKQDREQLSLMTVEPLTLKQVQLLLEPGVSLLQYFVTSERVLLWVIDNQRMNLLGLPLVRNDLIAKVHALREGIRRIEDGDPSRAMAAELYRLLIEPALPHILGKELLIVPHDVLHYLPFQTLFSDRGKLLIEDYPVSYLSSASLLQFIKEKKQSRREKVLAVGNPDLGDAGYNLRFAEREAQEIVRRYPASTVLVRNQATKSQAVAYGPAHDILHFAVHAEYNEEEPMSSALLLARDGNEGGELKASEIFSLNLKADLVVLSACETGLGKINSGDEIIGLARAFIYAGTPSIITTLWQVNDRASYELMREFYANLRTMKKSEALRQAQLTTKKEFPQPFFWAAYVLTGEP